MNFRILALGVMENDGATTAHAWLIQEEQAREIIEEFTSRFGKPVDGMLSPEASKKAIETPGMILNFPS